MTFLYDIGRVLLDFNFEASLAGLLPADCNDPEQRLARLNERKDEFESGAIDSATYVDWAIATLGCESTPEQFRHAWRHIFTPIEPMWRRVRQLSAAGHRLILFSNTNPIHCPWVFETFPEFSLFHAAVLSYEAGCIKPRPAIYQHAIDAHGLDPARTLYIDDLPQNIATGRDFGFQCHLYDLADHPAFDRWLSGFPI